jgi:hypothetical protein
MATTIAVLSLLIVAVSVFLIFIKPQAVFYIFITVKLFENIFGGYIAEAGNLGMPRTWMPGDLLWIITLAAAFLIHKEKYFENTTIEKCLFFLMVLSLFSLLQGLTLYFNTALTYSRVVHFTAAFVFTIKYFTNQQRVNFFLKYVIFLSIFMFFVHMLVRFGIFNPPVAEIDIQLSTLLTGERGTRTLVPQLYIVLAGIAAAKLINKTGNTLISLGTLIIALFGIVLSETRSTYGAIAIMGLTSLMLMKHRLKTAIVYGLAGIGILIIMGFFQYDFFQRFRSDYQGSSFSLETAFSGESARGREYSIALSSYKDAPFFLLTGRGIGAMHPAVTGAEALAGYYHSEYLGWLDRCGLLGLATLIIMAAYSILTSFQMAKYGSGSLKFYGTAVLLSITGLMAEGIFHPILSHTRGASIFVCFFSIAASWQYLMQDVSEAQITETSILYQSNAGFTY